ncbi:unnamed protein product, partial [Mesorhabditis belari]|uniref:C-type lectin domain-containing protein n=1 Tax=Mesorhabditis belari TaxID=2138241 RepID=A0AAF3EIV2_9BILA
MTAILLGIIIYGLNLIGTIFPDFWNPSDLGETLQYDLTYVLFSTSLGLSLITYFKAKQMGLMSGIDTERQNFLIKQMIAINFPLIWDYFIVAMVQIPLVRISPFLSAWLYFYEDVFGLSFIPIWAGLVTYYLLRRTAGVKKVNSKTSTNVGSLFLAVNGLTCPTGWTQLPNEPVCIYAVKQPAIYMDALWQCEQLGGTVVKVQNAFENSFIFSYAAQAFNTTEQFIGMQQQTSGAWVYADRTIPSYQSWAVGEPKNGTNFCAIQDSLNVQWKTADCRQARPFFCSMAAYKCPLGWKYFDKTDSCYYAKELTGDRYTWKAAESQCQKMGAHLVSIHSIDEDDFVYSLVPRLTVSSCEGAFVWIGLDGNGKKGSGSWSDGSTVDYGFWSASTGYWGMPRASDANGYCSSPEYDWYSTVLNHQFGRFICKMKST